MTTVETTSALHRVLDGLSPAHQVLLLERYQRILPVLQQLLTPQDIYERNRTWPGVSPAGKGATSLLSTRQSRKAITATTAYAEEHGEVAEELWKLVYEYCRCGPVGLVEALPSELPTLVADELAECALFHRLAKHPRSDAGLWIRELLDRYADELGLPRPPKFVARYAFAADRRVERWFFGESSDTEWVTKTNRRLNLNLPYPHQRWQVAWRQLPLQCSVSSYQQDLVMPWLIWIYDCHTQSLMGFRLCLSAPTWADVLLTLRWSIWHFRAPWWKARGAPDLLSVSQSLGPQPPETQQALAYLHTRIEVQAESLEAGALSYPGLPANFLDWLAEWSLHTGSIALALLYHELLDYFSEQQTAIFAVATPLQFAELQVSLPWSEGIAAVLLLPSAGRQAVADGQVAVFDVPFDAGACSLADGTIVDVRYDPDDARSVYLVYNGAHVRRAYACAFEGACMPWREILVAPTRLEEML